MPTSSIQEAEASCYTVEQVDQRLNDLRNKLRITTNRLVHDEVLEDIDYWLEMRSLV